MLTTINRDKMTVEPKIDQVFERYAIYYAPTPDTALAQFANRWFDDHPAENSEGSQESVFGIEKQFAEKIAKAPKRYGLHGTIIAPFRLRDGRSFQDLHNRLINFASRRQPLQLDGLKIDRIGSFLALCPTGDISQLNQFAAQCQYAFETFLAPLTSDERRRRNSGNLTTCQKLNLELWGYPYVLDEFRFHITLTDVLSEKEIQQINPLLTPVLRDVCGMSFDIDTICLFGDPGQGKQFQLLERYPLGN